MKQEAKTKSYKISIIEGHSEDWQKIKGLSKKDAEALDNFVAQNHPLRENDLKEIEQLLKSFVKGEYSVFGVQLINQTENSEELMVIRISIVNEKKGSWKKKEDVWEKLVEDGFELEYEEEFVKLITENLDRVGFVKDGIGLRDFLFVSQLGVGGFDYPVFLVEDSDVELQDEFQMKNEKHLKGMEMRELVILNRIQKFFKETKRRLYIGVGFEENLNKLDHLRIVEYIREAEKKGVSFESILRLKREFPGFYDEIAQMPEETAFITKNTEMFLKEYLGQEGRDRIKKELAKMKKDNLIELIERL